MKIIGLFVLLVCFGCRQYYEPPSIKNNPDFLVVDGFLNKAPDSTYIKLTHTRNLNDTAPGSPELHASLMVESDQNTSIPLAEIGNGLYGNLLPLNTSEKYRLTITSSEGKQYSSDYVPFKQTPPIDSLTWEEDSSTVNFFINTHDPQNNTVYYRWQFEETWQYNTYLNSNFDYVNGMVVLRTPDQQIHNCWKSNSSPSILLGSTSRLSQDIVSHFLFNNVSKSTEKIFDEYSVQVSQYALTSDEFNYWANLKKNSEQLGTLFDAQPSQLNSNIHCLTNPDEPVMGYLSAATVQKKRIFLNIHQLSSYSYVPYYLPCGALNDVTTAIAPNDSKKIYEYLVMPNHLFTFWYDDGVYHVAENFCIDCRDHGGTNVKPDFWP
jgi:Domain of unknown function (DUF4249)